MSFPNWQLLVDEDLRENFCKHAKRVNADDFAVQEPTAQDILDAVEQEEN